MINILIVDDVKTICHTLLSSLSSCKDINVLGFAHDGIEALKKITLKQPDIVLIDVVMPKMTGIKATEIISRLFPHIKVILISARNDLSDLSCNKLRTAGAKGYLPKNTVFKNVELAIRTVYEGGTYFTPKNTNNLPEKKGLPSNDTNAKFNKTTEDEQISPAQNTVQSTVGLKVAQKLPDLCQTDKNKNKKKAKPKSNSEKPLFLYGDWLTVILGVITLSRIDGAGHYLAHASLFCLMLSLIARPIKSWWNKPLKYRRTIGIFAFAAAIAHALYATFKILNFDLQLMLEMPVQRQWGVGLGIISLLLMTPAAITSFQFWQKKLGKQWRKIHLLTAPALVLAIFHTIFAGSHYMVEFEFDYAHYLSTFGVAIAGILVFLLRRHKF